MHEEYKRYVYKYMNGSVEGWVMIILENDFEIRKKKKYFSPMWKNEGC